ncbi:hypothetical protein RRU94_05615 [Domibacillus sp. DTU_2020_1001157_1_SI_ALB_TIR_016]|uniref:hypothetical protein n=1 Tax=Domibacillus sp. DTU_2020_1001157_1_SI_ALB_TIR_016 TaxID=3077789 RepID=UPI0028E89E31|nr:hypothetical protein [Domibacillus sp. DTU_2020_1001157_1_SI_ALB_TIR_016]WNS77952.1 hypothetical protein RRU94_05615 [Domibacillus sp. DTU_2020_1001157_1_SI_ALB_TIR_016]
MFAGLYDLIFAAGITILISWNLVLFMIQFFKECNTGGALERISAFILLLFMYAKQGVLAGFGVVALALSTAVIQENSIGSWIITLVILGFSGLILYHFYPQFVELDEPKKKRK